MAGATPSLDYEEQLAQVRRAQEETRKFVAEQHKLMAEASKLDVERVIYPYALVLGFVGAILGALLSHAFR
jgi:hypothetical protein